MNTIDCPAPCTIVPKKINYLIIHFILLNYFIKSKLRIMMDTNVCAKT